MKQVRDSHIPLVCEECGESRTYTIPCNREGTRCGGVSATQIIPLARDGREEGNILIGKEHVIGKSRKWMVIDMYKAVAL